jgi:hypothetical protein
MEATDLINPKESELKGIIEKCEDLLVMINYYMELKGTEREYFETFRYEDALTFDVRDVIRVIEEESRSLLKALPSGDSDITMHEKEPEPASHIQLSPRRYAKCAELLMKIFGQYELHIVWKDKRKRKFDAYRQNHDSVALLTYCATFINNWHTYGGRCFKIKPPLAQPGPPTFCIKIMSPDGETDWTRMVWLLSFDTGHGPLQLDSLSQIEALLEKDGRYQIGVSYPLCAELLMQIFEKFDLKIAWEDTHSKSTWRTRTPGNY